MKACVLVLDSCGVGELPDADKYGDRGSNSIRNVALKVGGLNLPHLQRLGLGNIVQIPGVAPADRAVFSYGKMACASAGKDSTTGHWEHFGLITENPFPTYPDGFPQSIIEQFQTRTGRRVIGNKAASGTEIIEELGRQHLDTGGLIVYTSADSVFQVAAHKKIVPVRKLYEYCRIAREIMTGEHGVSRIIARPFEGEPGRFVRTAERHDFSLLPPEPTGLDLLSAAGVDVTGVGKIHDLFAGSGLTQSFPTASNADGIARLIDLLQSDLSGLVYANLVDFDMLWGHRNDYKGFAGGLEYFDGWLEDIIRLFKDDDLFAITADHGCDPTTPSTDHSREYVPILAGIAPFGRSAGKNLGVRGTFADLGATVLEFFGLRLPRGNSFLKELH